MRVALTGAASGIGAAAAEKLMAKGHFVTVFDIHCPPRADVWISTDFTDPNSIAAAVVNAEGPFDALINNAGLPPRDGMAAMVLNVNFIGLRTFWHAMLGKLASGASVVNTASRAGFHWRENLEQVKALMALDSPDQLPHFIAEHLIDDVRAYNLSKEAVIAMTIAGTEDDVSRGIRSNSVSPSAVATGILDDFMSAFKERADNALRRAGRAGEPGEIADLICFLASPQSGWIKGQDILIDGGVSSVMTSIELGLAPSRNGQN